MREGIGEGRRGEEEARGLGRSRPRKGIGGLAARV
jgi:hypothetical protein